MNKKFKRITTAILTVLLIVAFSFTILDSTAFARGSGGTSRSISGARSSPKSGYKSSTFSKANKSSSSNTTTSNSKVSNRSSWHFPTVIFWPFAGHYGYGYGHSSLLGTLINLIILIAVIYFIVWFIRRRRRR